MISEIENIEKGIVVSTIEYDANKRIIGIGTPTITPNPTTGVAPLSKQSAFIPEVKENLAQVAEKVLGANPNQTVPIQEPAIGQPATVIPTPTLNDPITTEAVNVEIPTELGNLSTVKDMTKPIKNSITELAKSIPNPEQKIESSELVVPVAEPVATPQEVLATEPTGINENLFATNPTGTVETTPADIPAVKPSAPISETTEPVISPAPLSFEPRAELSKPQEMATSAEGTSTLGVTTTPIVEMTPKQIEPTPGTSVHTDDMTEEEKKAMAQKLANIVSSIVSSKISEIAYNASYEEIMGLLNELSKSKTQNIEQSATASVNNIPTLVNPMLEEEKTMKMVA